MLLIALAIRTKTLRLGSAVMVLPWHNPVLLAEQAATLDLDVGRPFRLRHRQGLSAQRIQGLSDRAGGSRGALRRSRRGDDARLDERERFSHHGHFWQFEDIVVEPPPAQRPHPPFWVAAGSESSIRRAAARGFNLILDQYASAAQIAERIGIYRAERQARRIGLRPDADRGGAAALCRQGRSRQTSRAHASGGLYQAHRRCVAQAGRQERLACAGLCRQSWRHRGERAVRHARRDLRHAGSGARHGRRLRPAHGLRRPRAIPYIRPRDHAGLCAFEARCRRRE